jgi:hypothetical protein
MNHLGIIKELMDDLQGQMQYGKEDFESRLGRNKDSELSAMPSKDEGIMKKHGEHLGVNKDLGKKPEDEDISPAQMKGDPGEEIDEDEKLRGRVMRLRA